MRLALAALALVGCTSNQGPFVRDVRMEGGQVRVETCTLRLTTYPVLVNVLAPKMEWRNCSSADVDAGVTPPPAAQ